MMYRTSLTAPIFGLRREIDRLFEDTFQNSGERTGWMPAVNIRETASEFGFDVELPGLKPEQVEITCDNGVLVVRGEHQEERKEGDEGRYHLVERRYGSFSRSFQLPQGVDEDQIEAQFDNGLLHIRVPKAAIPQPRRIEIGNARKAQRDGQAQISGSPRGESPAGRKASEQKQRSDNGESKPRTESGETKPRGEMAAAGSR
jgi:HSP20 family protein